MFKRITFIFCLFVVYIPVVYANVCSDFFPGPRPFAGFGSIDFDLNENVSCNGSSNCSLVSLSSTRSPTIPTGGLNLGAFSSASVPGVEYNRYNSWNSVITSLTVASGTAAIYFDAQGNDIVIPENSQINASGSPSALLIVVYNGKLIVKKGSTVNAYIYADTDEVKFEENTTFTGGLTVVNGKLIIEKDSSYNYIAPDDNFDPHNFCSPPVPVPSCSDIFPGPTTFGSNGANSIDGSNTCNGGSCSPINSISLPASPSVSPSGSFTATTISDGLYEHTSWGVPKETTISFSGSGTAVIYLSTTSSIPKGTIINAGGNPANVMIIANASLSIAKDSIINAHIYAAGSVSIAKDTTFTGSVSAAGGLSIAKDGTYTYNSSDAGNISGHGFCSGATVPAIDHYLITHDGNGLTCAAETITIKACTNSFGGSCTESAQETSLNLVATGSSHSVTTPVTFTGNTTVNLWYSVPETASLSISGESISATNGVKCNNDAAGDCNIVFDSAGFIITGFNAIENAGQAMQTGGSSRIYIQAVKDNNGVCQSYFDAPGTRSVQFAAKAISPNTTAGLTYSIGGAVAPKFTGSTPSSTLAVALDFDSDSRAQLPVNVYNDAGSMALYAKHDVSGTSPTVTLATTSPSFYVQPTSFEISASNGNGVLHETTHLGTNTQKAGDNFTLTITAKNNNNQTTVNFGSAKVAAQRTGPAVTGSPPVNIGVEGTVTLAGSSFNTNTSVPDYTSETISVAFSDGVFSSNVMTYSEVGLISLFVKDAFTGATTENSQPIGRFIPDHFYLASTIDPVKNFCGNMTYMSQPEIELTYKVQARNKANQVTQNYIDKFNKATVSLVAENSADTINLGARLSGFGHSWANGELESNSNNKGQFTRNSAPDGAFDAMRFGIQVTDSDNVPLNDLDMLSATAKAFWTTDSQMRFGRWVIENAYGPETENLPVAMHVEYWDSVSSTWQLNELDNNCTTPTLLASPNDKVTTGTIGSGGLTDGQYRLIDKLDTDSVTVADFNATVSGKFQNGRLIQAPNQFLFTAPGEGKQGPFEFEYQVPAWLQFDWQGDSVHDENPSGLLQFGVFRGNDRIISWREIGN